MPFGTGTSLEGNVVGNEKGNTVSLEKMNKILNVNVEDFDCRVQACYQRTIKRLFAGGWSFFPIDPGANAVGMASTTLQAPGCEIWNHETVITGLTVVLPNGDIINTGNRTKNCRI